jgi:hypothetical protein
VRRGRVAGWLLVAGGLAGAGVLIFAGTQPPPLPPATSAGSCHAHGGGGDWLPDASCTPGLTNPRVTQANITSTICASLWSTDERKRYFPAGTAARVKRRLVTLYGAYAGESVRGYELDHLIPISLGGDPADVRNLWPQQPPTPNRKDGVERWVRRQVCSGRLGLVTAQQAMARDWRALDPGDAAVRTAVGTDDE